MSKPLVINLFAGPSCGKTMVASGICCLLNLHDINCEYITEYARDAAYEEREAVFANRCYLLGKQYHRIFRTQFKENHRPEIVVTDSPLLLNLAYRKETLFPEEEQYILKINNQFRNLNYFIVRDLTKPYYSVGRYQKDLSQCVMVDQDIQDMFVKYEVRYMTIAGDNVGINLIVSSILKAYDKDMTFYLSEQKPWG